MGNEEGVIFYLRVIYVLREYFWDDWSGFVFGNSLVSGGDGKFICFGAGRMLLEWFL